MGSILGEGSVQERLDLLFMLNLATSSDRARRPATGVLRVFAFVMLGHVARGVDTRPNISPSAIVERFLLAPENIRIGIRVKVGSDQIIGEGRDLLHAADSYVFNALRLTLLKECMVNLTRAEDVAPYFVGRNKILGPFRQVALEMSVIGYLRE